MGTTPSSIRRPIAVLALLLVAVPILLGASPASADDHEPAVTGTVEIRCDHETNTPWPVQMEAKVVNGLSTSQTYEIEMSNRLNPSNTVGPGNTITTWAGWTMDEAGPEVTVGIKLLPSNTYIWGPESIPNPCIEPLPHPPPPCSEVGCAEEPLLPEPPVTPEVPHTPEPPNQPTTEPDPAPVAIDDVDDVAVEVLSDAASGQLDPTTLPRTGASSVVIAATAVLVMLVGIVLTRADCDQRTS